MSYYHNFHYFSVFKWNKHTVTDVVHDCKGNLLQPYFKPADSEFFSLKT